MMTPARPPQVMAVAALVKAAEEESTDENPTTSPSLTTCDAYAERASVCKVSYETKYTIPAGISRKSVCVNPRKYPRTPRSRYTSAATASVPLRPACARHLTSSNGVSTVVINAPATPPANADAPN